MVELTSYGLIALTAVLVIAFCFAYGDELPPTREKSSHDLINDTHVIDSRIIGTTTGSLRLGRTVRQYPQSVSTPASALRKTVAAETVPGVFYNDSFQNDRGSEKAFNG
jgi:hypothetical protein